MSDHHPSATPIVRILSAAEFAAHKHAGQRRKGAAQEPYINHVIEVARLVAENSELQDVELVMACLLHDTVEDTDATTEQLTAIFGNDVASLVAEVTDDKTLPKETRKELQIKNASHKSPRAQTLKVADKISNLRSILVSPPAGWDLDHRRQYFDWAKQVVDRLPSANPALKAEFDRVYASFNTCMNSPT